ncbi:MAG: hypothetical protein M0R47_15920 [Methylobacter sp.]|uniref:hypothetical protein n=1 Tax=Methylobacter sp. TaxID=2051955 RepID=UPI0025D35281|nr:hypothetical protein [Methylobacter sp.]MCK9622008.1 hypothetical protein [Methylobacter sp.]
MKAKDLITLLNTIDADADVLTPVDNKNGLANEFTLTPIHVIYNAAGTSLNSAPHTMSSADDEVATGAYLLDGVWSVTFNVEKRKHSQHD